MKIPRFVIWLSTAVKSRSKGQRWELRPTTADEPHPYIVIQWNDAGNSITTQYRFAHAVTAVQFADRLTTQCYRADVYLDMASSHLHGDLEDAHYTHRDPS